MDILAYILAHLHKYYYKVNSEEDVPMGMSFKC